MYAIRKMLLITLPVLLVISVPWYRDIDNITGFDLGFGIPDWVTVAIICYSLHAIISAFIWIFFPPSEKVNED